MSEILSRLNDLINTKKTKYSIEKMLKAYHLFNSPLKDVNVIHVAGTNGKGSVSYKISKGLFYSGYKVGLFSSPHISSIRERIMIDFLEISEKDFEEELEKTFSTLDSFNIDLSFFEILTLLACIYFKKNKVDFAVIEVGLGGRLDATNVIDSKINVITSIGNDHKNLLGDTLDQIANEKAGIIKTSSPTVLGPYALYPSIFERAKKFSSKVYKSTETFVNFDEENQSIARTVLNILKNELSISSDSIGRGIKERPMCRFEIFDQREKQGNCIILDVAHNIDGLTRLKKLLDSKFGISKYTVVLGMSKDKEIDEFCKYLSSFTKEFHLAQSQHPRLESPKVISKTILPDIPFFIHESFYHVVEHLKSKKSEFILFLGSFYFMSEIREALGIYQKNDIYLFNDPILKN